MSCNGYIRTSLDLPWRVRVLKSGVANNVYSINAPCHPRNEGTDLRRFTSRESSNDRFCA